MKVYYTTIIAVIMLVFVFVFQFGVYRGTQNIRSADMKELITLREVMRQYPSSIIVIDCKQQKLIQHEPRKWAGDVIYHTGECR